MSTAFDLISAPPRSPQAPPSARQIARPAPQVGRQVHESLEIISELYNYSHWLFNNLRPHIQGKICEVGCGIGTLTQFLLNYEWVVGLEPFEESYTRAAERFHAHANVQIIHAALEQVPCDGVCPGYFDSVICANVLEHLEDDVASLERMADLLRPQGRVVILVPAHMAIYGQLDRNFGHYRRYNRASLSRSFKAAGLKPVFSRYMNAVGYFGWWWQSCLLQRDQITPESSHWFERLVPFLDAAERLMPLPFGQSLIMVGQPER